MATTSVVITGSTYTYTISNIDYELTCTPSNIEYRFANWYHKPSIVRNKSGSANSRYFVLAINMTYGGQTGSIQLAEYKATFTKNGKAANTITEVNASSAVLHGTLAEYKAGGATFGSITLYAYEDQSSAPWQSKTFSASVSSSGWTPDTPPINYTLAQTSPDPSIFGYIVNYAQASWLSSVSGAKKWTFSRGTVEPRQTINLSANGDSGSDSGYFINVNLPDKLITATSVNGYVTITNTLGGSNSNSATATVQPYSKPVAKSLALGRVKQNNEDRATMSIGWAVDILNKQSNVTQSITDGDISCTWECEDLSNPGAVFSSGTFNIINDGESMTETDDTTPPIVLVDEDTSRNHNDYDPDKSFKFTAYITDRIGESSLSVTAILNSEFYLICAREGGRGIGFGIVPPADEFYVEMPANFQSLTESSGTYSGGLNDEALLTSATITKLTNWLNS